MKRTLPHLLRSVSFLSLLAISAPAFSGSGECKTTANMNVQCSRASALLQIHVGNCKKIGKVVMQITDTQGRVLYREEGKAMTGELVRRLDKAVFPRGTHTLTVVAKDFAITQLFTIE